MEDKIISNEVFYKNDYLVYRMEKHSAGWARITYTGNDGVLVILEANDKYIFVEHERQTGLSLEIVRGFVENNETPEVSVKRELNEELKVQDADIIEIKNLGYSVPDNSITDRKLHVFKAEIEEHALKSFVTQLEEGVKNFKVFDKSEIGDLLMSDKISDVLTLAAFSKLGLKNL